VNIEPDSIAEQIPKILQMWYAEFVKKKIAKDQYSVLCGDAVEAAKSKNMSHCQSTNTNNN
jgi:hypothetical protein